MRANSNTKIKPKPAPLIEVRDLLTRKKSPVNSTLNSARQQVPKKHQFDDNITFHFTKSEIEQKIQEFVEFISKNKTLGKTPPQNYVNELKNIFCTISKGNQTQKLLGRANSSDIKSRELSGLLREADLNKQIRELEEYKATYQKKIESHAMYIADLEKKVDILIGEYEKTLVINQNLTTELEVSKHETSIFKIEDNKDQGNIELLAELEQSRRKSFDLQKGMTQAQLIIFGLEEKLKLSQTFENKNSDLKREIKRLEDELKESFEKQAQLELGVQSTEKLKQENQELKKQLQEKTEELLQMADRPLEQLVPQEQKINKSDDQNTQVSSEQDAINTQVELEESQKEAKNLAELLQKATTDLEEMQNKCSLLEIEIESKNRLEGLIKALRKKIETLETEIETLKEEKSSLKEDADTPKLIPSANQIEVKEASEKKAELENLNENDEEQGYNYSFVKSLVSPRSQQPGENENSLKKELEMKNKEIEDERATFKAQCDKYGYNLTMLSNKIQALVKINDAMGKDFEYLKYEFQNYRAALWSVYQEIRKHLDSLKLQESETETHLVDSSLTVAQKLDFLTTYYFEAGKKMNAIYQLVEARRSYI